MQLCRGQVELMRRGDSGNKGTRSRGSFGVPSQGAFGVTLLGLHPGSSPTTWALT